MAGLLYYLPNKAFAGPESIRVAGLADRFPTRSVDQVATESGPDGGPGVVFTHTPESPAGRQPPIGYYPDQQTWQAAGAYWIGRDNIEPVRPEDLQRRERVAGHAVILEDGQAWLVPVARAFPQGTRLPEALILGPAGELVREILPRYAQLWNRAERFWEFWLAANSQEDTPNAMEERDCLLLACEALAVNYRIGPDEASFLRLFTTANLRTTLQALVDVPALLTVAAELESKKKAAIPVGESS